MKFHGTVAGSNIRISGDNKFAEKSSPDIGHHSYLFSQETVPDDVLFEVQIERKKPAERRNCNNIVIGLVGQRPESVHPSAVWASSLQPTWLLPNGSNSITLATPSGTNVQMASIEWQRLDVHDRIGVVRLSNGKMHLYVNGADKGAAYSNVPAGCYAIVDLGGNFDAVSAVESYSDCLAEGMLPLTLGPWKIEDFKTLLKTAPSGLAIPSSHLRHKSLPGIEFFFKLYPRGYSVHESAFVALELCIAASPKKSSATAPVARFAAALTATADAAINPVFSKKAKFVGDSGGVLRNFAKRENVEQLCADDGSINLRGRIMIEGPPSAQTEYTRSLYETGVCSDFTIRVENETATFTAHRCLLAMASPFFAALFNREWDESKGNEITIRGSDIDAVKAMLQFIYGDPLCFNGDAQLAVDVLKLADQYDLAALKETCETSLLQMISVENMLELAQLGELCSAHRLKNAADQFIASNSSDT